MSKLKLFEMNFTDEYVYVNNKLVSGELTIPSVKDTKNADTLVASLCEALQHPSCKLTTLALPRSVSYKCHELKAIAQKHRPALDLFFFFASFVNLNIFINFSRFLYLNKVNSYKSNLNFGSKRLTR